MLSICIIGSNARRTADALSDRDVLLVGPQDAELDRVLTTWSARGWNASVFDRPSFCRLADVQSLFVQHVKQEGRIVRDDHGYLSATLASYVPKPDYQGERNDALRQALAIPPPNNDYWHDLCVADITYVLFRNAAILHLGSGGKYCFGFDELVAEIADEFGLKASEASSLLALRSGKHCYRARVLGHSGLVWLDLARYTIAKVATAMGDLRQSSVRAGTTTDDYFLQRLEELELVRLFSPIALDGIGVENPLYARWQKIKGAGGYPRPKLN